MTEISRAVRGYLLIVEPGGKVVFHRDGLLAGDAHGKIVFAGDFGAFKGSLDSRLVRKSYGVMLPPFVDIHTHVPQHPIRGRFVEGVPDDVPGGKLLAGLNKNVFPAEAKCDQRDYAEIVVRAFLQDTLSHGVLGGAVYVTPSPIATEVALEILPESWSVGLVMMNQNCPEYLQTRSNSLENDYAEFANRYGRRVIVTDRFAVAVDSPLRKRGVAIAAKYGLRTQTHLNEQIPEKEFVEKNLYKHYKSYTDVYLQDGLLNHECILAHCIYMSDEEWSIVRDTGSVIAHCPSSNLLLGSGVMSLDQVTTHGIPYAIATDVGASPTVSMLAEMQRFLQVHRDKSSYATPSEALYRSTRAPAELLGISDEIGSLQAGFDFTFIEVGCADLPESASVDEVIQSLLPSNPDHPQANVNRVTIRGKEIYKKGE